MGLKRRKVAGAGRWNEDEQGETSAAAVEQATEQVGTLETRSRKMMWGKIVTSWWITVTMPVARRMW